jgi:hypothetical protein
MYFIIILRFTVNYIKFQNPMKKTYLLIALFILFGTSYNVNAQKKWGLDVLVGTAAANSLAYGEGAVASLEPKYNVAPSLSLGLKLEAAFLGPSELLNGIEFEPSYSYLLKAEKSFGKKLQPSLGLGMGMFAFGAPKASTGLNGEGQELFGFAPNVGLSYKIFKASLEFNLPKDNNYVSFKIGVRLAK